MKADYTVLICSDQEHEKVFAEIQCNGKFVALISQEDGPDQLKVELPGVDLDERLVLRVVGLDNFLWVLEQAAKKLIGGAIIPSEIKDQD